MRTLVGARSSLWQSFVPDGGDAQRGISAPCSRVVPSGSDSVGGWGRSRGGIRQ